ncbi:MAG TPA: ABC transporter ATP-binding protein [Ktedonobacterales bacterium]|nr:ABC transporter ATP-binding protein [Ktedonobacterales bacterium]
MRYVNTSHEVLLDVRHLSVEYLTGSGSVYALNDVNFQLARGEIMGFVGESGSGKTTMANAIARLIKPPAFVTDGEVIYRPPRIDAQPVDVLKLSPKALRQFRWQELAFVFQSAMNSLNPVLTVGAQIEDVFRTHRPEMPASGRRERAAELLRLVGISPDRIKSYPHQLSGGMRQRVSIAIALALSPEMIIMDEPTTALDVVVQREILSEILALRDQFNFSVMFITHDLSLLLEIADRIVVMYAGSIIENASCDELRRQPRHPYTYGLLNSFPTIHGEQTNMAGIPGTPPDLRERPKGCAFAPRCPMVMPRCLTTVPPLRTDIPDEPKHTIACHLYDADRVAQPQPDDATFAAGYAATYAGKQ